MEVLSPTMPKQKRATIYEVARLAGVSHVTVSRAFSENASVSSATRQKIQSAAKRLSFQPNPLARGLNGAETHALAVVWPMGYTFASTNSMADLVTRFQSRGYHMQMGNTLNRADMTKEMLSDLLLRSVDAVVLNVTPETIDAEIEELLKRFRAALVITVKPLDLAVDQIVWDRTAAIRDVVKHFVDHGRRNIIYCGLEKAEKKDGEAREQYKVDAFLGGLESHGIRGSSENLVLLDYGSPPYNFELTRELIETRLLGGNLSFDAVLCNNDWMATLLMQRLGKHGLRVPQDVAVVGYDDSELVTLSTPPLASVNRCNEKLVDTIEKTVFERLENQKLPLQKKEVGMKFVYRQSAG